VKSSWVIALCVAAWAAGGPQDPGRDLRSRQAITAQGPILVAEEVFQATVTSVEDGDSVVVKSRASAESIALVVAEVDAPELTQAGGPEARAFLSRFALGKTVTVRLKSATERSARIEIDGVDVSAALIRGGMAWHCPRFTEERELIGAEADARAAKRGLWSTPRPTPPWLFRGAGACWQQKKNSGSDERPDFSGAWTAIDPPAHAGQTVTITQDAAGLTIERPVNGSLDSMHYKFEKTTSRVRLTPHGAVDVVAKARWNGPLLIVEERTWRVPGEEADNVRQILWVDARGQLNLEVSSPRPIGENDTTRWVLRRDAPRLPPRNDLPAGR